MYCIRIPMSGRYSYIGDIDNIELLLVWIMDIITSQKSELGEISLNLPRRPHDPYYSLHIDFLIYMYMNIYNFTVRFCKVMCMSSLYAI